MLLEHRPRIASRAVRIFAAESSIDPIGEGLFVLHAVLGICTDRELPIRENSSTIWSESNDIRADGCIVGCVEVVRVEEWCIREQLKRLFVHLVDDHGGCLPGLRVNWSTFQLEHSSSCLVVQSLD